MLKTLFVGIAVFFISLIIWSIIIPKAFAVFIKSEQVLGDKTNLISVSPTLIPFLQPSPTQKLTSSPSLKPSVNPTKVTSLKPTSTPLPTSSPVSLNQLDEWFTKYANKESINKDLLKKICYCESKNNPAATNGYYGGLFQFSKNTWISTRTSMNLNIDPDLRFNPEEAIRTAAFRMATQGAAAWPNCSK